MLQVCVSPAEPPQHGPLGAATATEVTEQPLPALQVCPGDMALQLGPPQVPLLVQLLATKAKLAGRLLLHSSATAVLLPVQHGTTPPRRLQRLPAAELVAHTNAVLSGADCVGLPFALPAPSKSIAATGPASLGVQASVGFLCDSLGLLSRALQAAEKGISTATTVDWMKQQGPQPVPAPLSAAAAAVTSALECRAALIVTCSNRASAELACAVASLRPPVPQLAVVRHHMQARQCAASFGTFPVQTGSPMDAELILHAKQQAQQWGLWGGTGTVIIVHTSEAGAPMVEIDSSASRA